MSFHDSRSTYCIGVRDIVNELLAKALQCEQENEMAKSEQYYLQALAEYPDHKDVLCHVAIANFQKGEYEKALDYFVQCYAHPEQDEATRKALLNQILDAYYQPNIDSLKFNYEKNIQSLLNYEHNYMQFFTDFEELPYLCIPRSDRGYYIFEKAKQKFRHLIVLEATITPYPNISIGQCLVGVDIFDPVHLGSLLEQTRDPDWINDIKLPIYLICKKQRQMECYMQLVDYTAVLDSKRLVFFSDYHESEGFKDFLEEHQAWLPELILGDQEFSEQIMDIVQQAQAARWKDFMLKQEFIHQLATQYDESYYKELFSGSYDKIRILFYTSRFTQVVQYATRDFMKSCEKLGIQCELVIEKKDIHRANEMELVNKIAEFKPNIIFRINYFKADITNIPSNIMFITWIQDPTYQIDSCEHAQKFSWNDFVLVYSRTWRERLIKTGYAASRLAIQINPIEESIFQKQQMSKTEKDFYQADIAFPGNYQKPEDDLVNLIHQYTEVLGEQYRGLLTELFTRTYDAFVVRISNNELIYKEEQCAAVINEMAALLGVAIEERVVVEASRKFFHPLLYNLHRKITLKWLIDAGFKIKLWGRGWDTDPYFKPYAMGLLEHGIELAKMYSCTKIIPGTFFWFTSHARSWESTSCGTLCMSRYVPEEFDFANIRECFTENEDFVFYHDRADLIHKVKYYLDHEEERQRMVESGRQKVLQKMTYDSAVRKCLALITENVVK